LDIEIISMTAAFYCACIAAVLFLVNIPFKNKYIFAAAEVAAGLSLACMTASLINRGLKAGHAPMTNRYESVASFAWSLGFAYWYVRVAFKERRVGNFIWPLAALSLYMVITSKSDITPLYPALDTWMFSTHVASAFLGYGFFGASFAGAVLYLSSREAASRNLEELIFRTGYYGFVLFTISMSIGGIWAYLAWGTYWLWKVKELWSFLIWIYYAGFLHAIYVKQFRGRGVAWLSILGFAIVMFTFLGVSILMKSTHQL
jgi:ABC-type transport system involved in cytochrome c biogenesis permease subunit